jgi:hypothetical protein
VLVQRQKGARYPLKTKVVWLRAQPWRITVGVRLPLLQSTLYVVTSIGPRMRRRSVRDRRAA